MNLTPDSNVLIQGLSEFISATHVAQMKAYGTNLVAVVHPGWVGQQMYDLPVFDLVEEVVTKFDRVETTLISVHPDQVLDAAMEAIAANIRQMIIISAGVPPLDMVRLFREAENQEVLIVGPNSSGIIIPGKILLGTQPQEFYIPGNVGIVSRSSTLTYEVAWELTKAGLGQSISVGIGSDAVAGSSFIQWLQILDEDEATEAIVLVGQPGGESEEAAAQYIAEAIDKPVVAYITGKYASATKVVGGMGNFSTIVGRATNFGTAERKLAAFSAAGVPVAERPSQIPELLKHVFH